MGDTEAVCWCGHPHTNGPACPKYGCSCVLHAPFDEAVTDLPDAVTAWTEFRREHYIAPNIDGPALESAFIQGHRTAVAALTTRAKHLADAWEPHPDGDIQMFVAQLLGSKDE